MEKNIFKNAYFDKAYRTRDNRKAIYVKDKLVHEPLSHTDVLYAQLLLETGDILEVVKEPGVSNGIQMLYDNLDIVSEWEEEIDEEHLDDLAYDYNEERQPNYWWEDDGTDCVCEASEVREAFKAGYKAAKKGE